MNLSRKNRGRRPKLLLATLVFSLSVVPAAAQEFKESEVGFVFSSTDFASGGEAGVGARFLHNYTPVVGFEFQGALYPDGDEVNFYQGSFHLKGTYRMEERRKINFFGIFGPGYIITDPKPGGRSTRFALNAGGGVEVVPRPDLAIRADFSDFILFTGGDDIDTFDFKIAVMYRW